MDSIRKSWRSYSLGLLVAWVIIFLLAWKLDSRSVQKSLLLIFCGFFVGWLSGTIRVVLVTRELGGKNPRQ